MPSEKHAALADQKPREGWWYTLCGHLHRINDITSRVTGVTCEECRRHLR